MSQDANGVQEQLDLSPLEKKRIEVEAKREANRRTAQAMADARSLALLDDEAAYEDARAKAYNDPNIGPDRCLGGLIEGAGFALFKWPTQEEWVRFQDRGMGKAGLTTTVADELTCHCVLYPSKEKWREMMRKNPSASVHAATKIYDVMHPGDEASGKGLRSLRQPL